MSAPALPQENMSRLKKSLLTARRWAMLPENPSSYDAFSIRATTNAFCLSDHEPVQVTFAPVSIMQAKFALVNNLPGSYDSMQDVGIWRGSTPCPDEVAGSFLPLDSVPATERTCIEALYVVPADDSDGVVYMLPVIKEIEFLSMSD